ncbi:cobalamin biosynthesis protein [Rhodococcus ruber]|uniref:Cobalamin biosynthesis protein n=1 Tax=Rhodococcus ruber TaxID=1830 RepID=A0ABT4MC77_9NOCA|nr:cobalamin biosynthesis protein [Rhodococcus ruber]MCZ4518556.1 cobalamin biosynthesis protein [Rhodococcus ruber]
MRVVVGIGARAGVDAAEIVRAIAAVLRPDWRVEAIASIDRKADLVAAVASSMGVRGLTYSAQELSAVPTPCASQRVFDAVGSASVAEAAALLAGPAQRLVIPRSVRGATVVAVAPVADVPANVRY